MYNVCYLQTYSGIGRFEGSGGLGQGVWGWKSPSRVQGQSPGGGLGQTKECQLQCQILTKWLGSGSFAPEADDKTDKIMLIIARWLTAQQLV